MSEIVETPVFTSLKPVTLANDDFVVDEAETYVKEVVPSEFETISCMNVSNAQQINVTAQNVDEMFEYISSGTQGSTFQCAQADHQSSAALGVDKLLDLARSLPKDLFVAQVLQDSSGDRDLLEMARCDIYGCIKDSDDYPFDSRAALKKRIHTRSGDSVESKLSADLHTLVLVLDGADWEDLRDVINIPKPTKKSQSAIDATFSAYPTADIDLLKCSIQSLQTDMAALKQENIMLKSGYLEEIRSLKSDIAQFKDDCEIDLNELRSLVSTNAMSIDRICDEKSNGIATIKSEMKRIKSDFKKIEDEPVFNVNINSLVESSAKVKMLERKLVKLEKRLQADRSQDVCIIDGSANASSGESQRGTDDTGVYTDESSMYSAVLNNAKGQNTLVRSSVSNLFCRRDVDKHTSNGERVLSKQNDSDRLMDCSSSEKSPESISMSTFINTDIGRPSKSSVSHHKSSDRALAMTDPEEHMHKHGNTAHDYEMIGNSNMEYKRSLNSDQRRCFDNEHSGKKASGQISENITNAGLSSLSYSAVTQLPQSRVTADVDSAGRAPLAPVSDNARAQPIQVRVSRGNSGGISSRPREVSPGPRQGDISLSGELDDSFLQDDVEFSQHVRKRTKRYYLGGFKRSIKREKLIKFVKSKGLKVTWINIWPSKRYGRVVIRLNIEMTEGCDRIAEPGFWPRGVKCHPWMSKNMYSKSKYNYSTGYDRDDAYYGDRYDTYEGEHDNY